MARQSEQKKIIKKILSSKIFLFLAGFALIGLALSVGRESYHRYQLNKEISKLEAEIKRMDGRNRQLANLMDYFSQDSFLEKEAKIKLNLQKPGETVVIFSEDAGNSKFEKNKTDEKISGDIEQEQDLETDNWWKWWEYFFSRD